VRTNGIVFFQPGLCDRTNLLQIIEQISIQSLFAKGAIEPFKLCVLLAGLDG